VQREESGDDSESANKEADSTSELPKVDSYLIESLSTMIDDYENIITKNYCVYTNYEDFSFAQSRSQT
jgi:hypothetical protein